MINENKRKYLENVVNFLNNTQGYIEDYQVRFLLLNTFDFDIEESVFDKYVNLETLEELSNNVDADNSDKFYDNLYNLYKEVGEKNE